MFKVKRLYRKTEYNFQYFLFVVNTKPVFKALHKVVEPFVLSN